VKSATLWRNWATGARRTRRKAAVGESLRKVHRLFGLRVSGRTRPIQGFCSLLPHPLQQRSISMGCALTPALWERRSWRPRPHQVALPPAYTACGLRRLLPMRRREPSRAVSSHSPDTCLPRKFRCDVRLRLSRSPRRPGACRTIERLRLRLNHERHSRAGTCDEIERGTFARSAAVIAAKGRVKKLARSPGTQLSWPGLTGPSSRAHSQFLHMLEGRNSLSCWQSGLRGCPPSRGRRCGPEFPRIERFCRFGDVFIRSFARDPAAQAASLPPCVMQHRYPP
jgi:hypothetical protein